MALLEMTFPPSFFDIITYLPYYIVEELDMCGPMTMRWMYPIERYMKTLRLTCGIWRDQRHQWQKGM
jgi:hypothetical protein